MKFAQKNQVVTQRFEAFDGNFKYGITAMTSDGVVQQVTCDVDETIMETQPSPEGEGTIEVPRVVRLGNISMANGYKNVHLKDTANATIHVTAFEAFLASITA